MTASPDDPHVGLVVEGAGDRDALPVLLRMHLARVGEHRDVLGKPVPANGRPKAIAAGGIEGLVATAGLRPGCVGVFVVLDGEGDCVADLGPELLARSSQVIGKPVKVALADRDFESWIYCSAETLGIGLEYNSERKAQSAISEALKPAGYKKPVWQPRLTHRMDLENALPRSTSLVRALNRFDELLGGLPPLHLK